MEFAFASRRQSTRHFGMGISLLAAFVFRTVEITGLLCSARHARRTEMYGVDSSRNTHSHCNARISSRRKPEYKPIIIKRYGGSSFTVSSRIATCYVSSKDMDRLTLQLCEVYDKLCSFLLALLCGCILRYTPEGPLKLPHFFTGAPILGISLFFLPAILRTLSATL